MIKTLQQLKDEATALGLEVKERTKGADKMRWSSRERVVGASGDWDILGYIGIIMS